MNFWEELAVASIPAILLYFLGRWQTNRQLKEQLVAADSASIIDKIENIEASAINFFSQTLDDSIGTQLAQSLNAQIGNVGRRVTALKKVDARNRADLDYCMMQLRRSITDGDFSAADRVASPRSSPRYSRMRCAVREFTTVLEKVRPN